MASLVGATQIGGVSVAIGANLDGLKAGEREARQIATGIDRIKATVKLTADTSQLRAEVARLVLPPVRVPLLLDFRGAMGQIAQFSAMARGAMGGGGGGGGLIGGGGGGLSRNYDYDAEYSIRRTPLLGSSGG